MRIIFNCCLTFGCSQSENRCAYRRNSRGVMFCKNTARGTGDAFTKPAARGGGTVGDPLAKHRMGEGGSAYENSRVGRGDRRGSACKTPHGGRGDSLAKTAAREGETVGNPLAKTPRGGRGDSLAKTAAGGGVGTRKPANLPALPRRVNPSAAAGRIAGCSPAWSGSRRGPSSARRRPGAETRR